MPFYHTTLWDELEMGEGALKEGRTDGWTSGQPMNNSSIQTAELCCLAWKREHVEVVGGTDTVTDTE